MTRRVITGTSTAALTDHRSVTDRRVSRPIADSPATFVAQTAVAGSNNHGSFD
jgi:hypothetical protein